MSVTRLSDQIESSNREEDVNLIEDRDICASVQKSRIIYVGDLAMIRYDD